MKFFGSCLCTAAMILGLTGVTRMQNASGQTKASATFSSRKFYLSRQQATGGKALSACAAGYHMGSPSEIWNTSSLQYDTSLGVTETDSGSGAPSGLLGWIRTGYNANTCVVNNTCNCTGWTSNSPNENGSTMMIAPWNNIGEDGNMQPQMWQARPPHDSGGLHYGVKCSSVQSVWCVED